MGAAVLSRSPAEAADFRESFCGCRRAITGEYQTGALHHTGNSAPIADKHYLTVTAEHYEDAVASTKDGAESGALDAEKSDEAAENAAQEDAAPPRTAPQETKKARENRAILLPDALACDSLPFGQVPPRGVEPLLPD